MAELEFRAYITDCAGAVYELPHIAGAELHHGLGEPCDCAEIAFYCEASEREKLSDGVYLCCTYGDETVFYGVVDEYTFTLETDGLNTALSARGMAARLMDNESGAVEYELATLGEILRRHVAPCGIDKTESEVIPPVAGYRVYSGTSEWDALRNFTLCAAGIEPRFSRSGVLILKKAVGRRLAVTDTVPITGGVWRDCRSGIISEAEVRDLSSGSVTTVENADFKARGGLCRRYINVTSRTDYRAPRYTGEYQIQQSMRGKRELRLTLPLPFAAEPDDILEIERDNSAFNGLWRVTESVCRLTDDGWTTELYTEQYEEQYEEG